MWVKVAILPDTRCHDASLSAKPLAQTSASSGPYFEALKAGAGFAGRASRLFCRYADALCPSFTAPRVRCRDRPRLAARGASRLKAAGRDLRAVSNPGLRRRCRVAVPRSRRLGFLVQVLRARPTPRASGHLALMVCQRFLKNRALASSASTRMDSRAVEPRALVGRFGHAERAVRPRPRHVVVGSEGSRVRSMTHRNSPRLPGYAWAVHGLDAAFAQVSPCRPLETRALFRKGLLKIGHVVRPRSQAVGRKKSSGKNVEPVVRSPRKCPRRLPFAECLVGCSDDAHVYLEVFAAATRSTSLILQHLHAAWALTSAARPFRRPCPRTTYRPPRHRAL